MKKAIPFVVGIVALFLLSKGATASSGSSGGSGGGSASGRRGLRNFNPGNIRKSSETFVGEKVPSTDPDFKQFTSMVYGARAMLKILLTYMNSYGLNTITKIVNRWAPAGDGANNPAAYANYVSKEIGIGVNTPLSLGTLFWVANAMVFMENGKSEAVAAGFGGGNQIWNEAYKLIT